MSTVFMFPGQSSRYPEMIERIIEAWTPAASIVSKASQVLKRDLRALYREDAGAFECNRDIQVGVFLASHLHLAALGAAGVTADLSLGLSLGEYNHLVHIEALTLEDALLLVDARGRLYDEGPSGMMASIFPLTQEELCPVLAAASILGVVEIANLNSPTQNVVAGTKAAVLDVMARVEEEHGIEAVVIEQRIPMHTSLFRAVGDRFRVHLERARWQHPKRPYLPNAAACLIADPTPAQFIDHLARHVYSPVRWRESIDLLVRHSERATFIEVGPRAVLYNLLQKRWHPVRKLRSDVTEDLASNLGRIGAGL